MVYACINLTCGKTLNLIEMVVVFVQTDTPVDDCRKKIWLVDSKVGCSSGIVARSNIFSETYNVLMLCVTVTQGLLVESRKESLQHFKKPFAHEHEPMKTLLEAVQSIKPTVLIGTSGVGRTFTKEVIEAMASFNEVRTY